MSRVAAESRDAADRHSPAATPSATGRRRSSRCATSASPFGGVHAVDGRQRRPARRRGRRPRRRQRRRQVDADARAVGRPPGRLRRDPDQRPAGDDQQPARRARRYGIETIYQTLALADNIDAAGQHVPRARAHDPRSASLDDSAMESATRKVMRPPQPAVQELQDAGEVAVRRPAPVGGHRPGGPLQRPDPDHGRADRGARPGRDGAGPRPRRAAEGRGHRHLPDQPRHPRRVRPGRPDQRDAPGQARRHRRQGRRHQGRGPGDDHHGQEARRGHRATSWPSCTAEASDRRRHAGRCTARPAGTSGASAGYSSRYAAWMLARSARRRGPGTPRPAWRPTIASAAASHRREPARARRPPAAPAP